MTEYENLGEPAAAPEEVRAARLLAEALGDRAAAGADERVLATARLLQVAGGTLTADEVSRARLRRRLVAAAGRRQKWRTVRRLTAAAAVLVAVVALGHWLRGKGKAPDLAAREAEARAAVASIATADWGGGGGAVAVLHGSLDGARRAWMYSALQAQQFERLRAGHLAGSLGLASAESAGAATSRPTPGGLT